MSDDATNVQRAKDSLDVLNEVFQLGSKFSDLSNILIVSGKLASAFPVAGAILGLIAGFLPDENHEEILRNFEKLSNKIDQVKDGIKELRKVITWEITELQYGDDVGRIQKGMSYCSKLGKRNEKHVKMYQQKLKDVCANDNYTLALDKLLDGVTGNGLFSLSILDKFYENTNGDRQRISALATRLLQLICGGMMAIATYETLEHEEKGAEELTKSYDSRLKDVYTKVHSVLDRCVTGFRGNMLNDLNKKLDEGGSNEGLVMRIRDFMRKKYDWLENFCVVYNEVKGFGKHCFSGYLVESLHHNGKCGLVFYRTKGEPAWFSDRYDVAYKIVDKAWCEVAVDGYQTIVTEIEKRDIKWTGCVVVKHGFDLRFHGTFSTKIVSATGQNATAILLLK